MYAPLKPREVSVPNFIKEYDMASDRNWAWLEENYAAYYNEDEYSSFVEVISEKQGYPSKNHSCSRNVTSTISVPPVDEMMSSANAVQDQDPIPGTVFGPIAFPEPEIIPITTDVIQVTTGHDLGISGRTISNTTTENITQPDVASNGSVTSEPTTSTISVGNTTLTPAVVTTEPLAKSVPDLTDNQMTQPQISGTVVNK